MGVNRGYKGADVHNPSIKLIGPGQEQSANKQALHSSGFYPPRMQQHSGGSVIRNSFGLDTAKIQNPHI